MFRDLKSKNILITGSTSGIGLAIALAAASYGARIGLHGLPISPDEKNKLCQQLLDKGAEKVELFFANIMKTDECESLVTQFAKEFGDIDVLINNAGGLGGRATLTNIDDTFYERVMDLNVRSVLMVTKFAIPYLRQSALKSGQTASVISTGSIAAREGGGIGAGIYAAAKSWVHDVHRNWVKEFTADHIRFNIVSPGTVDTAFHNDKSDELKNKIASTIPMGRFGKIEELAPSYLFFASHACSGYITGQILDVNGGQIMP